MVCHHGVGNVWPPLCIASAGESAWPAAFKVLVTNVIALDCEMVGVGQ